MMREMLTVGANFTGLVLSDENIRAFELYANEMKKWNRKINLTAITSDREIAIKHFIDSLLAAQMLAGTSNVLDIGSGAGLPALAIKIFRPGISVVSVDAVAKKIHFQRHVARLLQLEGFEALHARVEDLQKSHAGKFEVIISRAFSDLGQFVSLAAPLLGEGGRIIAMKGPASESEMTSCSALMEAQQFEISSISNYRLPDNCGERRLITISSVRSR
jgi:16S rRNA (guanine527-N7)-methyltransferase